MSFTHRMTWHIGLNRGAVSYPASEAIEAVKRQLSLRGIDGFTVTHGVGYWKGEPEECLVVTVMVDDPAPTAMAYGIAADLALELGQEAVAWSIDALVAGGLAFAS